MKNVFVWILLLSALIGGLGYLCSDKWFIGAGIGIASFACSLLLYRPSLEKASNRSRLRHECYLFLHRYLITLSVTTSLEKAYEAGIEGFGERFRILNGAMEGMNAKERTEYLAGYFQSDTYRMFLSLLRLHEDRGGDVLSLSSELMNEASREEENAQSYEKEAKRKFVGYLFLWLVSIGILTFLRFGLSSFFASLSSSPLYMGSIALYFAFFLFSLFLFIGHYTGEWPSLRRKHV